MAVEPDGIEFNRTSIEVSGIKEDADYEGVRVQFLATLARARIPMQLDIGFGDVISPGRWTVSIPSRWMCESARRSSSMPQTPRCSIGVHNSRIYAIAGFTRTQQYSRFTPIKFPEFNTKFFRRAIRKLMSLALLPGWEQQAGSVGSGRTTRYSEREQKAALSTDTYRQLKWPRRYPRPPA